LLDALTTVGLVGKELGGDGHGGVLHALKFRTRRHGLPTREKMSQLKKLLSIENFLIAKLLRKNVTLWLNSPLSLNVSYYLNGQHKRTLEVPWKIYLRYGITLTFYYFNLKLRLTYPYLANLPSPPLTFPSP